MLHVGEEEGQPQAAVRETKPGRPGLMTPGAKRRGTVNAHLTVVYDPDSNGLRGGGAWEEARPRAVMRRWAIFCTWAGKSAF